MAACIASGRLGAEGAPRSGFVGWAGLFFLVYCEGGRGGWSWDLTRGRGSGGVIWVMGRDGVEEGRMG